MGRSYYIKSKGFDTGFEYVCNSFNAFESPTWTYSREWFITTFPRMLLKFPFPIFTTSIWYDYMPSLATRLLSVKLQTVSEITYRRIIWRLGDWTFWIKQLKWPNQQRIELFQRPKQKWLQRVVWFFFFFFFFFAFSLVSTKLVKSAKRKKERKK